MSNYQPHSPDLTSQSQLGRNTVAAEPGHGAVPDPHKSNYWYNGTMRAPIHTTEEKSTRRWPPSTRVRLTCAKCRKGNTSLWRRNSSGEPVCNACGLDYKLSGIDRPLAIKKDSIQEEKKRRYLNEYSP